MSRLCKKHPIAGWLSLAQQDYRRTFDRLIQERDLLNDPSHSEPAPGYVRWVWATELPGLVRIPFYERQFREHIEILDERIEALSERVEHLAGGLQREATRMSVERLKLLRMMGVELECDDEQD